MAAAGEVRILDQRTPEERGRPFLPGMGRTWLLPLYDVASRLSGDRALHTRAVALAGIAPGQAVLDVGCGTGNLTLAVLAGAPDARVTGLDPDGAALRRAAFRVLRPGGTITIVDFGGPEQATPDHAAHGHGKAHFLRHLTGLVRSRVVGVAGVPHSLGDTLPALLAEAGFDGAHEVAHVDHRQGRLSFVQATRP